MSTRIISVENLVPIEDRLDIITKLNNDLNQFREVIPSLAAGITRLSIDSLNFQEQLTQITNDISINNNRIDILVLIAAAQLQKQEEANVYLKEISTIVKKLEALVPNSTSIIVSEGTTNIVKTAITYTAISKDIVIANTTQAPFTINLPVSPKQGDMVTIANTGINELTVISTDRSIQGESTPYTVASFQELAFIFVGSSYGWSIVNTTNASNWNVINTDYTITESENLFVNTANSTITLALPLNPVFGQYVSIVDIKNTFDLNPCSINGNGKQILGNSVLDLNIKSISLILYFDGVMWILAEDILSTPVIVNSNYIAHSNELLLVDATSSELSITLPSNPVEYDKVSISDTKGIFSLNHCTIQSNHTINGNISPLILDINYCMITFVYINNNWVLKS
jgi:hypothetical protein